MKTIPIGLVLKHKVETRTIELLAQTQQIINLIIRVLEPRPDADSDIQAAWFPDVNPHIHAQYLLAIMLRKWLIPGGRMLLGDTKKELQASYTASGTSPPALNRPLALRRAEVLFCAWQLLLHSAADSPELLLASVAMLHDWLHGEEPDLVLASLEREMVQRSLRAVDEREAADAQLRDRSAQAALDGAHEACAKLEESLKTQFAENGGVRPRFSVSGRGGSGPLSRAQSLRGGMRAAEKKPGHVDFQRKAVELAQKALHGTLSKYYE